MKKSGQMKTEPRGRKAAAHKRRIEIEAFIIFSASEALFL